MLQQLAKRNSGSGSMYRHKTILLSWSAFIRRRAKSTCDCPLTLRRCDWQMSKL